MPRPCGVRPITSPLSSLASRCSGVPLILFANPNSLIPGPRSSGRTTAREASATPTNGGPRGANARSTSTSQPASARPPCYQVERRVQCGVMRCSGLRSSTARSRASSRSSTQGHGRHYVRAQRFAHPSRSWTRIGCPMGGAMQRGTDDITPHCS